MCAAAPLVNRTCQAARFIDGFSAIEVMMKSLVVPVRGRSSEVGKIKAAKKLPGPDLCYPVKNAAYQYVK